MNHLKGTLAAHGAAPSAPTAAPGLGVKPISKNVNEKYQNGITNWQPKKTKTDLKNLYSDPKGAVDPRKIQRWAAIQVIKAFFGMPIVPGK